jgi:hypothetical protein
MPRGFSPEREIHVPIGRRSTPGKGDNEEWISIIEQCTGYIEL